MNTANKRSRKHSAEWLASLAMASLFSVAATAAEANQLTPAEKAGGWQLLFDGKTMNGWRDPRKRTPPGDAWAIEGACLAAQPNPSMTEDLVSLETFDDFELVLDWRISRAGNSGLKYRIQDLVIVDDRLAPNAKFEDLVDLSIRHRRTDYPAKGQEYVVGFEYQMIDNRENSDAKYGPIRKAGALYEMVPVSEDSAKPAGEFNHSRLVVRGMHTEHWLNGVKVVDAQLNAPRALERVAKRWGQSSRVYELLSRQPRKSCPISLQNHGFPAWFQNIKIRRLH